MVLTSLQTQGFAAHRLTCGPLAHSSPPAGEVRVSHSVSGAGRCPQPHPGRLAWVTSNLSPGPVHSPWGLLLAPGSYTSGISVGLTGPRSICPAAHRPAPQGRAGTEPLRCPQPCAHTLICAGRPATLGPCCLPSLSCPPAPEPSPGRDPLGPQEAQTRAALQGHGPAAVCLSGASGGSLPPRRRVPCKEETATRQGRDRPGHTPGPGPAYPSRAPTRPSRGTRGPVEAASETAT